MFEKDVRELMGDIALRSPVAVKRVENDDGLAVDLEGARRERVRLQALEFVELLERDELIGRHNGNARVLGSGSGDLSGQPV